MVRDNGNRNGRPPRLLKPSHNPVSILVSSMEVVYSKPQGDPHANSGHSARRSFTSAPLASRPRRPVDLPLAWSFRYPLYDSALSHDDVALSAARLYLTTWTQASNKEDPQREVMQCDV